MGKLFWFLWWGCVVTITFPLLFFPHYEKFKCYPIKIGFTTTISYLNLKFEMPILWDSGLFTFLCLILWSYDLTRLTIFHDGGFRDYFIVLLLMICFDPCPFLACIIWNNVFYYFDIDLMDCLDLWISIIVT